ncbi:MAG: tetratricopeptide repeat protein [Candidatus Viridilinea halotolerans]|uniref:Tetratricopeptide repeat protein n=1 Tax=Candidatus Viridilinea halotolerans TaxID=2491704 RepID=A0A426TR48_9CHLR|nr:MAG: tetratricopeptide repeat protein [Candidatus Viridilinea halotolerans]
MTHNENDDDDFTLWLKGRRQALHMTQAELGRVAGYAPETIRAVEAGRRKPSRQMVKRLADALHIDSAYRERFFASGLGLPLPPLPAVALDDAITPPRHRLLSLTLPELLGRADLLAQLQQRLMATEVRLLTLVGPPGVGKTRLAREVAHTLERRLATGAVWVPLAGVHSVEQLLEALAHALRLTLPPARSLRQVVLRHLQPCALLLVFDNIEQLHAEAEQLAALLSELLATAPQSKILVTSQVALQLAIEQVVVVPPLAVAAAEAAQPSPASHLFAQRAQAHDPSFALTAQNLPVVEAICRELDGLPLALELAATRCRLFALEDLLARLDERLELLAHQGSDRERRHHSLRAALEWSVALLTPAEQAFLGVLSLFQGGFSLAAAEQVGGAGAATLAMVEQLLNHSLLNRVAAPSTPRFALLESVRLFARERLPAAASAHYARRHAAYYLSYVQQDAPTWGQASEAWAQAVEYEAANLDAALAHSLAQHDGETLAALVVSLSPYWVQQGRVAEGRQWADAALRVAGVAAVAHEAPGSAKQHDALPPALTARLLVAAADLAYEQSDFITTERICEKVLVFDAALVSAATLIRAHYRCAWLSARQGKYAQAQAQVQQGLALAQRHAEPYGEAMLSGARGWLARDQGDFAGARTAQQRSLALYRQLGDRLSMAYTLNNLGWLARDQDDYARSEQLHREALQLYQAAEHPSGVAQSYNNLGWVAGMRGTTEQAAALFAKSLALREAIGNDRACAWTLSDLGWLWREAGDGARAASYYHAAHARYQRLGDRRGCAISELSLAQVRLAQSEREEAQRYLSSACAALVELRDRRSLARLLDVAAAYAYAQGNPLAAAERLGAAEALRAAHHTMPPASETRWLHTLEAQIAATAAPGLAAARAAGATRAFEQLLAGIAPAYLDLSHIA